MADHDMTTTRPRYDRLGCDTAKRPCDTADSARTCGLAGGVSYDTIVCIMTGGRPGRLVYRETGVTRPGEATIWRRRRAIRPEEQRHGTLCYDMVRAAQRCDTAGRALRHDHDTTPDATRYGRPNAQRAYSIGHGCAHCALDPVLTHDTVLSHCL